MRWAPEGARATVGCEVCCQACSCRIFPMASPELTTHLVWVLVDSAIRPQKEGDG